MSESIFEIGAKDVNVEQLVRNIQAAVTEKTERGVYSDAKVARAERTNLANLRSEDEFLDFYMKCLREAVFVDISDFEIRERRPLFAPLLIGLKKIIWSLLKFYTYRLWSQQNQVNGLIITAIEGLDEKYSAKIKSLEKRIQSLEKKT